MNDFDSLSIGDGFRFGIGLWLAAVVITTVSMFVLSAVFGIAMAK